MKKIVIFSVLVLLFVALLSAPVFAAVQAEDGSAYSPDSGEPVATDTSEVVWIAVGVGAGVGLLTAGIALFLMCRAMSTVRKQKNADTYMADGSFRLSECRDVFLYSRVSRVRVNTNSNKR